MCCGLTEKEAAALTPARADIYLEVWKQRERLEDIRFARLMCLLANIHRNPKSKKLKVSDFLPREARPQMSDEEIAAKFKQIAEIT